MQKIIIENFKGIQKKEIVLSKFNALMGGIGAGKSSTIAAFRYVLTGKFDTNPIYKDGLCAKVTIQLDDENSFARQLMKVDTGFLTYSYVNGRKCTQVALAEFIKGKGVDVEMFEVTTNPYVFSQKTKEEITSIFLSIIPTDLDFDKFAELADIENPDTLFELECGLEELGIDREHIRADDVEQIYKHFYNVRTETNRYLKTYKEKCKFEGEKPTFTKEEVEKQRSEIVASESIYNERLKLIQNYNEKVKTRENLLKLINEKKAKMESMGDVKPADIAVFEKAKAKRDELERDINNINLNIATAKSNIQNFEKALQNLDGNHCPLSDKLICQTDKTPVKTELSEAINQNKDMRKRLMSDLDEKKKSLETVTGNINKWTETKMSYEAYLNLKSDIERLTTQLPDISDKPAEIEAKDFAGEKEILNRKSNILVKYAEYLKNKKKVDELQFSADIFTNIIKATSPKGKLNGDIIQYAAAPFVAYMNSITERINEKYAVKLEVDNGLEIMCKNGNSDTYVKFQSLSGGERILYTFVLFDTINQIKHNRLLLLDDLDRLDANNMKQLLSVIEAKSSGYDNIIISMIDHEDLKNEVVKNKYDCI